MTPLRDGVVARSFRPASAEFPLTVSLFVFPVVVHGDPRKALFGFVAASAGMLVPSLRTRPWFWWLVGVVSAVWYVVDWPVLDNHVALAVYWTLAIAVCLHSPDWSDRLARLARLMIGLVFVLALVWKLRSPDFLDGGFFEYTLLVDPRFEPVTRLLGMTAADLEANRILVASGGAGALASTPAVEAAARTLTAGTLVVEGAVALGCLAPVRLRWPQHAALVAFAVITYLMVPVLGFGFVLLVMGVAATHDPVVRRRYALGAAGLFLYGIVWNAVVL